MEFNTVFNVILITVGILILIPCSVFFLECWAAFISPPSSLNIDNIERPQTTVLIPAHNEAAQITEVIEVLLPQLTEQDQVIVIADNCHDNTAELAKATGVKVLERENATDRGKGYALDYAIQQIKHDPPEVLIILDGDCILDPNSIKNISCQAIATGRPIQSAYLMEQPENPSLNRLGWHSLLTGSGMAFPWSLISQVSLAGSKTTDDTQLTVDLALAGSTPVFCEQSLVVGRLMKDQDAQSQRSRWEHGQLEMIMVEVPRLLKAFLTTGSLPALGLALDISIPPLSLLIMTWIVIMGTVLLATIFTSISFVPVIIVGIAGVFLISGLLCAWIKFGRSDISLKNLVAIPFYILGKIPIYLKFLVKPQSRWLKTERDLPDNN